MEQIGATIFNEAVTRNTCKINLNFGDTDLYTTSHESVNGNIIGTSSKTVVERIGKPIDILKIDCEGAEWQLFEDRDTWKMVRSVSMEYHLWAKENSTVEMLVNTLISINFKIVYQKNSSSTYGLITGIKE